MKEVFDYKKFLSDFAELENRIMTISTTIYNMNQEKSYNSEYKAFKHVIKNLIALAAGIGFYLCLPSILGVFVGPVVSLVIYKMGKKVINKKHDLRQSIKDNLIILYEEEKNSLLKLRKVYELIKKYQMGVVLNQEDIDFLNSNKQLMKNKELLFLIINIIRDFNNTNQDMVIEFHNEEYRRANDSRQIKKTKMLERF